MSQLFDALHKSESERGAKPQEAVASGPELLEVAERQFRERRSTGTALEELEQHASEPLNAFEAIPLAIAPNDKLVCVTDAKSLAAEKFRFLSLRLTHLQQRKQIKALLITSSVAEEGKSMIAANVACALAGRQQQKVLLVEGDLRRPTLASMFGLDPIDGLGNYLQDLRSSKPSIYQLGSLGLDYLPAGEVLKDPLALLQSDRMTRLIDELRSQFDWIVVDSPPILPLGDTSAWMRLMDGILMVARPGKTAKKQLERGLEAIDQAKLIGAIINESHDVDVNDYYHYYGTSKSEVPVQPKV